MQAEVNILTDDNDGVYVQVVDGSESLMVQMELDAFREFVHRSADFLNELDLKQIHTTPKESANV